MQSKNVPVTISCPLHPSEFVQRVDMDMGCSQQLYCLECILSNTQAGNVPTTLQTINDLISQASTFYAIRRDNIKVSTQMPQEFSDLLSNQNEKLEKLSKHIEHEKQLVISTFDQVTQTTLTIIDSRKNEFLAELDKQLFNLRYWYIYLDKQIKKTYPTPEDINFLFPSKEELDNKLQKLSNITQLTALVRNLKEDLAESKLESVNNLSEDARRSHLQALGKKLTSIEEMRPNYKSDEGYDVSSLKSDLQKTLDDCFDKLLVLENKIEDVSSGGNFGSKLLDEAGFNMIKEWMPNGTKFNPKLLYRSSKDGENANAFHSKCDNKGATITIIKCKFDGEDDIKVIGGYLDQSWNSTGQLIYSNNSFLFSVTKKKRTQQNTNPSWSGYGIVTQGPTFGGGPDLAVLFNDTQNYCNACNFHDLCLHDGVKNTGGGNMGGGLFGGIRDGGKKTFKLIDLEVYKI